MVRKGWLTVEGLEALFRAGPRPQGDLPCQAPGGLDWILLTIFHGQVLLRDATLPGIHKSLSPSFSKVSYPVFTVEVSDP